MSIFSISVSDWKWTSLFQRKGKIIIKGKSEKLWSKNGGNDNLEKNWKVLHFRPPRRGFAFLSKMFFREKLGVLHIFGENLEYTVFCCNFFLVCILLQKLKNTVYSSFWNWNWTLWIVFIDELLNWIRDLGVWGIGFRDLHSFLDSGLFRRFRHSIWSDFSKCSDEIPKFELYFRTKYSSVGRNTMHSGF